MLKIRWTRKTSLLVTFGFSQPHTNSFKISGFGTITMKMISSAVKNGSINIRVASPAPQRFFCQRLMVMYVTVGRLKWQPDKIPVRGLDWWWLSYQTMKYQFNCNSLVKLINLWEYFIFVRHQKKNHFYNNFTAGRSVILSTIHFCHLLVHLTSPLTQEKENQIWAAAGQCDEKKLLSRGAVSIEQFLL